MSRKLPPPSPAIPAWGFAAFLLALAPSAASAGAPPQDGDAAPPPADEPAEPADVAAPEEAVPAPEVPEEPEAPGEDEPAPGDDWAPPVHGYLRSRYLMRGRSGETDHDLYTALSVDFGERGRDPFTGHLHAYLGLDLDGDTDPSFTSISDSYDDGIDSRLYQAYLDAHDIEGLSRARFGRQQITSTPVLVWFDGLGLESETYGDLRLRGGAYGGLPVRIFESSRDGDALFGGFVESRPWDRARWRLDYVRFTDESELGDQDNDLWHWNVLHGVGDHTSVGASYSFLDDQSRDWRVTATGYRPDLDLTFRASYYELLETQGHLALELDPLFSSLLELFPYSHLSLLASKGVEEWLLVEAGADVRTVSDDDDVGEFNRDFDRYYVSATLFDLGQGDFDLTLTADVYDSERTDAETWGADLSKDLNERTEASVGSYYSLYKYDLFLDEERDDIRTYYVRLDYEQTRNLSFDVDYEFEDGDEDYQTLKVGLSWRF